MGKTALLRRCVADAESAGAVVLYSEASRENHLSSTRSGRGAHTVGEIASALGGVSEHLSSTRNQLVKKDVVYAPAGRLLEFRMPLTERYVERHRVELERRAALARTRVIRRDE
jgi:hypothetical protein